MKRSVREKNSIVIWFVFYFILLFSLILFISLYTIGTINEIEEKKDDTKVLYNEIVKIKTNWLSYGEFKKITSSTPWSKESDEVLKNITSDFYSSHLMNTDSQSFELFIKAKTNELNSEENTNLINENEEQIVNILPTYSDSNISIWDNSLTDFEFINYIESIFDSFNLSTRASIGIWNVIILDEYIVSGTDGGSLDSNIYSIPLNLNLVWTKTNIIDFLYFVEKVWTIDVKNNEIFINTESEFLSKNWFAKILSGDRYTTDYKIFENQIIDIDSVSMPSYIDSSYNSRNDMGFIEFIKTKQGNDDYEIKVNLLFYVKWLPKYKVLNSINTVISNYRAINTKTNSLIWGGSIKWIELLNLKKRQNLLKNLNKKILAINKDLRSNKDLEVIYKNAIELNDLLQPICDEYGDVCK